MCRLHRKYECREHNFLGEGGPELGQINLCFACTFIIEVLTIIWYLHRSTCQQLHHMQIHQISKPQNLIEKHKPRKKELYEV
jgi:hypothetical protein